MLYACAKLSQGSRDFFFFREQNFHDWKATHENHENFPPRKFSAIRYLLSLISIILFLKTDIRIYYILSRTELARLVMGTILLV